MRHAVLIRTSGPYSLDPAYCGIWSDPETTAEVLRIGYDYEAGGCIIDLCTWGKPDRYRKALNEVFDLLFHGGVEVRYQVRICREWYFVSWAREGKQYLAEGNAWTRLYGGNLYPGIAHAMESQLQGH